MPKFTVVFYQEDAETVPVLDWLDRLPAKARKFELDPEHRTYREG